MSHSSLRRLRFGGASRPPVISAAGVFLKEFNCLVARGREFHGLVPRAVDERAEDGEDHHRHNRIAKHGEDLGL